MVSLITLSALCLIVLTEVKGLEFIEVHTEKLRLSMKYDPMRPIFNMM